MSFEKEHYASDFYDTYLDEISRFQPLEERTALFDIDYVSSRYNPEEWDDDWRGEETRRSTERRPPATKRGYVMLGKPLR
jgi:hypothetical protein